MARLPVKSYPSPTLPEPAQRQLASDVLGFDHPLTRASDALDTNVRQLLVVATVLAGSVAVAIERVTWARPLALAAGIVLLGIAAIAAIRAQIRRDRALDLILEGREALPISVVQRQRRRLASPRARRTLARTLVSMVQETLDRRPPALRSARPLLHRPMIAEVQDEIRAVAELLRSDRATVRGVAFSKRIMTHPDSPLYGRDVAALRDALRRARTLLEHG